MATTRLQKIAAAVAVLQGLIGVGVPLMQFFLVFNMNLGHLHPLITTGVSVVIAAALGLASTLSQGPALPALHVTAALLLAALMGAFNTQTFLDLDNRCNIQQAAIVGCSACPCAATNSCTEKDLATDDAACASCRALGTDLCMRVRWLPLLMPFTGLIEAVVLALPAFLSLLLLLLQRGGNGSGGAPMAVVDAGGQGAAQGSDNVKVLVNAWPGHGPSEPGDWPSATPAEEPSAAAVQRAPSTRTKKSASKHLAAEPSWQQQEPSQHELGLGGGQGSAHEMMLAASGHEYGGGGGGYGGLEANASSGYLGSEHSGSIGGAAAAAPAKKKASTGLKKKLKSTVPAARTEASIGSGY